jgi:hypothetical protein
MYLRLTLAGDLKKVFVLNPHSIAHGPSTTIWLDKINGEKYRNHRRFNFIGMSGENKRRFPGFIAHFSFCFSGRNL